MKCLVLQPDVSNNKSVIVKPLNEIQPINPFKPKPELSRFIEDFIGYYMVIPSEIIRTLGPTIINNCGHKSMESDKRDRALID